MPADYLSRNLVAAISWDASELQQAQNADPLLKALKSFLLNKELPHDPKCQQLVKLYANDCFIEDDIIWRRIKRQFEPSRVIIFLPASLKQQALVDAHGNQLVGHDGIYKTKERLFQCYYWPGMDTDIAAHLKACHRCQIRRTDDRPPPSLLSSLLQPTEPNHRVHADLFGPLKTSDSGKKFILCMTDALTKYVELVPLPNKKLTLLRMPFLTNGTAALVHPSTLLQIKASCLTSCSKGLAPTTLRHHPIIPSATAKRK